MTQSACGPGPDDLAAVHVVTSDEVMSSTTLSHPYVSDVNHTSPYPVLPVTNAITPAASFQLDDEANDAASYAVAQQPITSVEPVVPVIETNNAAPCNAKYRRFTIDEAATTSGAETSSVAPYTAMHKPVTICVCCPAYHRDK